METKFFFRANVFFFSSLLFISQSFAAPAPLPLHHHFNFENFKGRPLLEVMTMEGGIKESLDEDFEQTYQIASAATVIAALDNFDTKIVRRVLGSFPDGRQGLKKFSQKLAGKDFQPSGIVGLISANYAGSGNIYALAHFFAMASGAGTLVQIDKNNYYYNFGYRSGAEVDDVKSGRSYGAGPDHNANDASDVMYLDELEAYLQSTHDAKPFFKTLVEVITQSDTSGFSRLSREGQTVLTDFVAIYTAELDRHIMVDLDDHQHPWENDLAEATFIGAFSAIEGKVMKDGMLQVGQMREYWAQSEVSTGSGIGITRSDHRNLQRQISNYIRENEGDLAEALDSLTGGRSDGDLFRALTEHINNYETQSRVRKNAGSLASALVALLEYVQSSSTLIAETIESSQQ